MRPCIPDGNRSHLDGVLRRWRRRPSVREAVEPNRVSSPRRSEMSHEFPVDSSHLLLIGSGPGVGAAVVRRFGRERFRSTLVSRGERVQPVATALRQEGIEVDTLVADAHLRTAYDGDVLGGVVAAQVAASVMRGAGAGMILSPGGGLRRLPGSGIGQPFAREGSTALGGDADPRRGGARWRLLPASPLSAKWPVTLRLTPTTSRNCFGRLTLPPRMPGRGSAASRVLSPEAGLTPRPRSASRAVRLTAGT
jgi:hypothetical protein